MPSERHLHHTGASSRCLSKPLVKLLCPAPRKKLPSCSWACWCGRFAAQRRKGAGSVFSRAIQVACGDSGWCLHLPSCRLDTPKLAVRAPAGTTEKVAGFVTADAFL